MEALVRRSGTTAIWEISKLVKMALAGFKSPMRKSCFTENTRFLAAHVSAMLASMTSVRAVMSYRLQLEMPVAVLLVV